MLSLEHNNTIGGVRLVIKTDIARAWICYYPPEFNRPYQRNWRMYVQRKEHEPPFTYKSQTQLLIESRLRAWLLQRFRLRLRDLRFEELCAVAENKFVSGQNARLLEKKRRHHIL